MVWCKLGKVLVLTYLWLWWLTTTNTMLVNAANDSLKPGDTLYTNSTHLCSENGRYCMGFARFLLTKSKLIYLIIYENGNRNLRVWVSNRNQPTVNNSTFLSLDQHGVLKIESPGEEPIILYSSPQPTNNTVATLLNTGNFVLQKLHPDGTKAVLWQSFDFPSDTFFVGMKLGVNHKTGHKWSLVSWLTSSLPTPGPFRLEWEPKRSELIIKRHGQVYWTSGKLGNNRLFEHIPEELQDTYDYEYTIVSNEDEDYFMFNTSYEEHKIWILTENGQLITGGGLDEYVAHADLCYGYNTDGGCQRWEDIPTCRDPGDVFEEKVGYPNYEYTTNVSNTSLSPSDCLASCWRNCECFGYREFYDDGTGCTFFMRNSTQGIQFNSSGDSFYMLQVQVKKTQHKDTKKWIWISIIIASALLIACPTILCLAFKKRKYVLEERKRKRMEAEMLDLAACNDSSGVIEDDIKKGHDLKIFNYTSIKEATNEFSCENKLGQGGFGPVYKGILPTGQEVAVKRLSKTSGQGIVEFKNELALICELQHMNLVQLLGCCIHEEERILIYEYMPNKSLDFYLFDCTRSKLLDWEKRINIIEGISQGLLYLHKYSRLKIIHRDLKASNILLDENMNPKISDFGMARIFTQQESMVNTNRIVGTYGYMSPEYAMEGIYSTKSDVYSFGVLLLEIVSGRRNNSFYDTDRPLNLIGHAWELWNQGMCLELLDPSLGDTFVHEEVERCIHVGLLCVEQCPDDRSTMSEVISMLTNKSASIALPRRPAFYFGKRNFDRKTSSKESYNDSTMETSVSFEVESK